MGAILSEPFLPNKLSSQLTETNPNSRLEAFCDGVFAIALTLLIIDVAIPSGVEIHTTSDLWSALLHVAPSAFTFVLSFIIIFITWVNHHASLKLVGKSSPFFIYANGFLLLTIVFLPFPTGLLGEYLLSDHAAPAVVLYESTLTLQAVSWIALSHVALTDRLCKSKSAEQAMRRNNRFGYFAFLLYALCAIVAFWFPLLIAIATTCIWIFWLIYGINIRHEEVN
jgi:uncharacterized membrane protein